MKEFCCLIRKNMRKLCYCVILLVALSWSGIVHGYPSGAPTTECTNMTPRGSHGSPQSLASSPYQIVSSAFSDGYIPGQTYNVSIEKVSSSSPNFKGFLCQVREVGQTSAVGGFAVRDTSKSKTLACTTSTGAVTHKDRMEVEQQTFDWTAPQLGTGSQVEIFCTIVETLATLWVQQKSQQFTETAAPDPTTLMPPTTQMDSTTGFSVTTHTDSNVAQGVATTASLMPTTMTPVTTTHASTSNITMPTTMTPVMTTNASTFITFDFSECGSSVFCYRDPADCQPPQCQYALIARFISASGMMSFSLSTRSVGYVALGFSEDRNMGRDDVVACQRSSSSDMVYVKDTWNPNGRSPNVFDSDTSVIASSYGTFQDGAISCRIDRYVKSNDTRQDYGIDRPYYLLYATSAARGGQTDSLSQHSPTPMVSASQVLITSPAGVAVENPTSKELTTEPTSSADCRTCPFSFLVVLFLVVMLL